MPFKLPDLPYPKDALAMLEDDEPVFSAPPSTTLRVVPLPR